MAKNKAYDYSINDYKEYNIPNSPFGDIRVYVIDGLKDVYFNGKDLGTFLKYKDPHSVTKHIVSKDYKKRIQYKVPGTNYLTTTNVINKDGVIEVITRTRSKRSFKYKKWLYEDITPQILSKMNFE